MAARLRKVVKVARTFDIGSESGDGTSHWQFRREDGEGMYPIPANHGLNTEISDKYINGLCRHFDIDRDEFKAKL